MLSTYKQRAILFEQNLLLSVVSKWSCPGLFLLPTLVRAEGLLWCQHTHGQQAVLCWERADGRE